MSGDWLLAIGVRGGPLVATAQRFLRDHAGAPRSPFPSGVEGLRRLAHAIDAWAERETEDAHADESFVEGAGALLASLLLEHFEGSSHAARGGAHRVRIGAHGFFDPFAAIERAFDAPDAREALADEVARAEAEAQARSGVGRAVRLLIERLAAARDDLALVGHFEAHVELTGGIELDLTRVLAATDGESDHAATAAVDKLIALLPGSEAALGVSADEAHARLLPRLVGRDFELAPSPSVRLFGRHVLGRSLTLALVLAYDGRARYVRTDELARWSLDEASAVALALTNLAQRSADARFVRVDTSEGAMVVARSGDGLDGARLLLPTLPDVIGPELGLPCIVAAPHRDALWACAASPRGLVEALAARVRHDARRAPHRISDTLFTLTARGLVAEPRR